MAEQYSPEEIAELLELATEEEREWLVLAIAAAAPPRPPSLMEFIPETTPTLKAPLHLKPIVDWIEEAVQQMGKGGLGLEAVVSTPPQHGKTTVLLHALVWLLKHFAFRHIYCTYNLPRARELSQEFKRIALRAGVALEGNLSLWRNPANDAEVKFAAVDGGDVTGRPCDGLFLVDDPFSGLADARSAVYREAADIWFQGTATTRMHPGSSKLIVATRWDVDDLSGRRVREGWKLINLPAFLDGAAELQPLWPAGRPREFLLKQKASMRPSVWAALYLGQPVRDEARVFGDVHHYVELPKEMKYAIGVDLAYTRKTSADWSVAVVLGEYSARWYVIEVVRLQVTADKFALALQRLQEKYPGAPTRWYTSTTEQGTADVLRLLGLPVYGYPTHGDKLVRASPASLAWNRGAIFLPDVKTKGPDGTPRYVAPWYEAFVKCVTDFTGNDDPQDDDVDALAAAFDQLAPRPITPKPPYGSPEWHRQEVARMREESRQKVIQEREEDTWQSILRICTKCCKRRESTASCSSPSPVGAALSARRLGKRRRPVRSPASRPSPSRLWSRTRTPARVAMTSMASTRTRTA